MGDDRGIVAAVLGADGKPVYANPGGTTRTTTGQTNFDQWYRDVPDVNMTFVLGLHFVQNGKVVTFAASINNKGVPDSSFFPLDDMGFGNQGENHNFSFTTEIHTSFTYNGGETFTFQGDDDVWVFINNQLAIDLGGIHVQETQLVNLDAQAGKLGISVGNTYSLAVFNAERHTVQSNFRIDTTLSFADCGQVAGVIF
jgi:fibro-slime domain-containing protein